MIRFRLCLALGFPHPDYLIESLTAKQLRDWEIYYQIEPFGEEPDFLRTGILCSNLLNIKLKEGSKRLTAHDFMPVLYDGKRSTDKQTPEDLKKLLSSMSTKKRKK